jgi:hypothetical protein
MAPRMSLMPSARATAELSKARFHPIHSARPLGKRNYITFDLKGGGLPPVAVRSMKRSVSRRQTRL